jgi:hypothetical protein
MKSTCYATLLFAAVSAVVLGCSTSPEEPAPAALAHGGGGSAEPPGEAEEPGAADAPGAAVPLDPASAPPNAAELRYLVSTDDGTVYTELPTEMLTEIERQLVAGGHQDELSQLRALYDFQTGRVRSLEHARAAEIALRGGAR